MKMLDYIIQGLKPSQIAERLGLTLSYVSTVTNSPNFQHQLSIRRAKFEDELDDRVIVSEREAVDVLRESARKAAEKMVALVDSPSDAIALRSSSDIMDRVGPHKQQRNVSEKTSNIVILDEKAALLIHETLMMEEPCVDGDEEEGESI